MTTVTRKLEFDAGHRLVNHESKCKHLHGHRYVVEITVHAEGLDEIGRIVDFSVIKGKVGGWIDEHWDHNMILNSEDEILEYSHLFIKPPYVFHNMNPTAENMAACLFEVAATLLPSPLTVKKVRLYETPNCYAEYEE